MGSTCVGKKDAMAIITGAMKREDLVKPVTRAEFAKIAVVLYEKLSGKIAKPSKINPFADTDDEYALKAYNLGITAGTSSTTFSPENAVNRLEAAVMLTRTLKCVYIHKWNLAADGGYTLIFTMPPQFKDDDSSTGVEFRRISWFHMVL